MLEVKNLVSSGTENVLDMDDGEDRGGGNLVGTQVKMTIPANENTKTSQLRKQNPSTDSYIITICQANKNELETLPCYCSLERTAFQENNNLNLINQAILSANNVDKTGSKWLEQWEIKCKEWFYMEKFNVEILNFAKNIYIADATC